MSLSVTTNQQGVSEERADKLAIEQLRLWSKNVRPGIWWMPTSALVTCAVLSHWIHWEPLALWLGAVVLSNIPHAYVVYRLGGSLTAQDVKMWKPAMLGWNLVYNAIWTSMAVFFWVPAEIINNMFLLLILATTVAGHAALVSPVKELKFSTFLPFGLVMILMPFLEFTPIYFGLSLLSSLFLLYQLNMFDQTYATVRDMLLLREDKNDLITQLETAKSESDRARMRAEAASRAKSEFLANMSHELRTPLNAIIGFSEIMRLEALGPLENKTYKGYACDIHMSGQHLLNLINDILDLSRIEAGRYTINAVEVDLKALANTILRMFDIRAEKAGITLALEIEDDLKLFADERGLRQVLLNLISNAVKFTRKGGTVKVFGHRSPHGGAEFGVSDTGVGIAPQDVPLVFENFGQGQHDITLSEKGTGLGLPIVKGLVEAHGGVVKLVSEVGRGTTVTVFFPKARTIQSVRSAVQSAA